MQRGPYSCEPYIRETKPFKEAGPAQGTLPEAIYQRQSEARMQGLKIRAHNPGSIILRQ